MLAMKRACTLDYLCVHHVTEKTDVEPYDTETHSFRSKGGRLEVNSVRKLCPTVFWECRGVLVDFTPEARQWKLFVTATRWTG